MKASLREVHRERIATPGTDFAAFVAAMQGLIARAEALGLRAPVGIGLPASSTASAAASSAPTCRR
jgi:N-acetylglucosamine kinase